MVLICVIVLVILVIESSNFFQWTASMHFEHAAVLEKFLTKYCISHAAGIDAETVTASVSSCDFWNGTLSDNTEWFTADFGTKKAEPFYQLLSNAAKDTVKSISLLKLKPENGSPILMVLSFEEKTEIPPADNSFKNSLLKIIEQKKDETDIKGTSASNTSKNAFLYLLSLKLTFENFILKTNLKEAEYSGKICSCIYDEIFFMLQNALSKHHIICKGSNYEIKIALFLNNPVDAILLQSFIIKNLETIFNKDSASKALVLSAGSADKTPAIHNFLVTG